MTKTKIWLSILAVVLVAAAGVAVYFCVRPPKQEKLTFAADTNLVTLNVGQSQVVHFDKSISKAAIASAGSEDKNVVELQFENSENVTITGKGVGQTDLVLTCYYESQYETEKIHIVVESEESDGSSTDSGTDVSGPDGGGTSGGGVEDSDADHETPKTNEEGADDEVTIPVDSDEVSAVRAKLSFTTNYGSASFSDSIITMASSCVILKINYSGTIENGELQYKVAGVSITQMSGMQLKITASENGTYVLTLIVQGVEVPYLLVVNIQQ